MNAQASVHGGCIGAARAEQCMNRLFCQCMRLGLVIAILTACNDGGGSPPRPAAEIATLELAALESGDGDAVRDRLDDAYPAVWFDSSDLSASRFGEVKFEARDGKHLSAFVYRGTAFDPLDGPIWFVMHGAKRGAKGSPWQSPRRLPNATMRWRSPSNFPSRPTPQRKTTSSV